MLSADEAKRQTDELINKELQEEWDCLDTLIRKAISEKRYQIEVLTIYSENEVRLQNLGYSVQYKQLERDESGYLISWRLN